MIGSTIADIKCGNCVAYVHTYINKSTNKLSFQNLRTYMNYFNSSLLF